jgi:hypothetical protein
MKKQKFVARSNKKAAEDFEGLFYLIATIVMCLLLGGAFGYLYGKDDGYSIGFKSGKSEGYSLGFSNTIQTYECFTKETGTRMSRINLSDAQTCSKYGNLCTFNISNENISLSCHGAIKEPNPNKL